jgi:FKBP-type peptidyl-prolyl cis-trans isomerase 2
MPVQKGDFILLNYTCKVKESGEIIEATTEKAAKDYGIYKEGRTYEPLFIVVGEGWVPKGLDESLIGLDVGKTLTIEVPPEKAYGPRDPSKIRLLPLRRFRSEGLTPTPGMQVEIDGKPAQVRAVGAGRVQVDYNHPLAGKNLIYEVSVEKILEDKEDKIKAIIHKRIPGIDVEKFKLTISEKELTVEVPDEAFFIEGLQLAKRSISTDLQKFMPEIEKTSFVEVFRKPPAAPEGEPKQA